MSGTDAKIIWLLVKADVMMVMLSYQWNLLSSSIIYTENNLM